MTKQSQLISTTIFLTEYMRNFKLKFFTNPHTFSPYLPLKDQEMRLNELNGWQSRKESLSNLKPLLQASLIAKMVLITSAYKDFWTPRKEKKLPIYSPLLPRKIAPHAEKPGHPLAAPSVLIFTQLTWGISHYACVS